MHKKSLREKVIAYRKKGYSYKMISEKFGLSKSTLSDWLRHIPFQPNQQVVNRIGMARIKTAVYKNKQKIENINTMKKIAFKDIGKMTKRDLFFLGIGLYLGEGVKLNEHVRFINSDPKIIQAAIKWFKEICYLKDKNFKLRIHLYPDTDIDRAILYWSKITKLKKENFQKTQIDKRINKAIKKRGKLPYGTLHIQIKSHGDKTLGRSLHRKIMGWLEASLNQI